MQSNDPERGSYRKYDPDQLTKAYFAVKNDKMPTCKAARIFNVPRSTLQDRLFGKVDVETVKSGPSPLLSQEQEAVLAGHLKTMDEVGYGYSRQVTINLATDYAVQLGLRDKEHPLTEKWLYSFLSRWPELRVKKPRSLDVARARSATRSTIDSYFNELEHILTKYNLCDKPQRVYNIDEKGMSTEHKPPKVIGGKFSKSQAVTSGRKKTTTLIGCANGVGNVIPPFFVFPVTRFSNKLLEGASAGADGCVTESGWSNTDVFERYIKTHLIKYLPSRDDGDILVLYDGHKSHITVPLIQWAKSQHIHLFVLPPHCSHLQPLDVCAFGPFQNSYNSACHKHTRDLGVVNRYNVCSLACKVYDNTLTPANIKKAFCKSGIFPLDKTAISDSQVAPATSFVKETVSQVAPTTSFDKEAVSLDCAESFLLKRGGRVLENVQRHKIRNTLSKIVGGKCITEDEVLEKIIDHENKHKKMNKQTEKSINECQNKTKKSKTFVPKPSTFGTKSKKRRIEYSEDFSSSENESDVDESSKCIICKRFSPDSSKRPDIIIVKWGQCDTCLGWVHLGFCSNVRVLRRGDSFLCPNCDA